MIAEINTNRLRLIALDAGHLRLLAESRTELEDSLGLKQSHFELNCDQEFLQGFIEEFNTAVPNYILPSVEQNPEHYEWFTHWLVVLKNENLTVGGIGLAGLPNENGEVMLGYFIDKKFEGQGIATEAVEFFCEWFRGKNGLNAIVADTPKEHKPSQVVLLKNGFSLAEEQEEVYRWQKSL